MVAHQRFLKKAPFDPPRGKPHPKGPNGKNLCRWCGTEVSGRRISWCSDKCVEEYLVRKSSADVRRLLEKRDHGVCRGCGADTTRIARLRNRIRWRCKRSYAERKNCTCNLCLLYRSLKDRDAWDADHILPVEHGGGCCGLDNYQTLCRYCHKRKTKAQANARRRAAKS